MKTFVVSVLSGLVVSFILMLVRKAFARRENRVPASSEIGAFARHLAAETPISPDLARVARAVLGSKMS